METENSYVVLGADGRNAKCQYIAVEQSSFLSRMFCGNKRPWQIRVIKTAIDVNATARTGFMGAEFDRRLLESPPELIIDRPLRIFKAHAVSVRDKHGRVLGMVRQEMCRLVARGTCIYPCLDLAVYQARTL